MQLDLDWTSPISPIPIVQIISIGPCPMPSLMKVIENLKIGGHQKFEINPFLLKFVDLLSSYLASKHWPS